MKAELICVLVLLTAVVQGIVVKKSQLKREQLLSAILQRGKPSWAAQSQQVPDRFEDSSFYPDDGSYNPDDGSYNPDDGSYNPDDGSYSPDGGSYNQDGGSSERASSIEYIQELLYTVAQALEPLKEEVNNCNGEDGEGLMNIIDSLTFEIQMLESELYSFPDEEMKTATIDLLFGLYYRLGEDFFESVWEIYENSPRNEEPSMTSRNFEGTGNNVTQSPAAARLSQLVDEVMRISEMVSESVNEHIETALLLRAMTDALYESSTGTSSSAGTTENTTPGTEAPTETPTTTTESQTTPGESQTTEGGSQTTEGGNQTTTTENMVMREKQLLRRRLTDLLLKKILQRDTA